MDDQKRVVKLTIINSFFLLITLIMLVVLFARERNSKASEPIQIKKPSFSAPSPDLAFLRFKEYYEPLSEARKKCIASILGEARIAKFFEESPLLLSVPLTEKERTDLGACIGI